MGNGGVGLRNLRIFCAIAVYELVWFMRQWANVRLWRTQWAIFCLRKMQRARVLAVNIEGTGQRWCGFAKSKDILCHCGLQTGVVYAAMGNILLAQNAKGKGFSSQNEETGGPQPLPIAH